MPPSPALEDLDPAALALLQRRLERQRAGRQEARREPISRQPDAPSYPLSFAQERLWFFDLWQPRSPVFNVPAGVWLRGALKVERLATAMRGVVARHEALRTTIERQGKGAVQVVAPPGRVASPLIDLSALDAEVRQPIALGLARAEARRPFDLARGPLVRLTLLCLDTFEHLMVLVIHHIVSDAWSTGLLIGELAEHYRAATEGRRPRLAPLPIQYRDYAAWQRRQVAESPAITGQRAYWRSRLCAAPPVVEVPTDRPRSGPQRFCGRRLEVRWGAARAAAIRELARRTRATPFLVLAALFKVLIFRTSGQRDVVLGTLVAERNRPEIEGLIGWFANTLALRTDLGGRPAFRALLERVRQTSLDAFAHADLPFERVVEEVNPERDLTRNALFQMMLVVLDEVREGLELPGLTLTSFELEKGVANFDLYFSLLLGEGGVGGFVDYNTDLYDATTVVRTFAHFGALLEAAARDPEQGIDALPLLAAAEAQQVAREWNDTARTLPPAETVIELFEARVAEHPEAPAVTFEGASLSYREINGRANRLAHQLRALGVGPEVVVGVLALRSLEMVVALYGVLKAGGAYLPLEPSFPAERLATLTGSAGAPVIVTQERFAATAAALAPAVVVLDGAAGEGLARLPAAPLPPLAGADNLAYVIYTSGSTGRPKGVMNVHGALVNRLLWMQEAYALTAGDTVVQKTPFVFDVSVWEFFWPLITGARLVVAKPEGHRDGAYLADLFRRERVTAAHFVPSMLRLFLTERSLTGLDALRLLISSGEALTADAVEPAHQRLPATIHNLYGPTEAAIDVTAWEVPRGEPLAVLPIGRPISNLRLYVVGRHLEPVPAGALGELTIGGAGLARGYRAGPAQTAGAFVPSPFAEPPGARLYRTGDLARTKADGTLEYLGRLDTQVKVRGLRIELGEIEGELAAQSGIRQAVVLAREDTAGDQRLAAYLLVADGVELDLEELEAQLRRRLPEYMVPGAFVVLHTFPLTPTGKVDRKALPRPAASATGRKRAVPPRTALETRLAAAFAEVLRVPEVGIFDNFFHRGGHSLLAAQLLARLAELVEVEIPLPSFFAAPTVADLAAAITAGEGRPARTPIPRQPRAAGEETRFPLSFAQERLWFLGRLDPEQIAYNEPSWTRIRGALATAALAEAFATVARRQEAFATRFEVEHDLPVQVVAKAPVMRLPLVDFCALPPAVRAGAARRAAVAAARRPFDLTRAPLVRAGLFRAGEEEHLLLLVFHHIVADGWSYYALVRELAAAYSALAAGASPELPELPIQYADFACWQRAALSPEALAEPLAYWRRELAGAPALLSLPTDRPRPQASRGRGGQVPFDFTAELYAALGARAAEAGVTLVTLLLAAKELLLARLASSEEVLVGLPVAGRSRAEVEGLLGFFVNTVVVRGRGITGRRTVGEHLAAARTALLGGMAHQELPFDRLVSELGVERNLGANPVFQVALAFQNALPGAIAVPGLTLTREALDHGATKFDLTANLYELDGRLQGYLEYDRDLFDATTAARWARHFVTLLGGFCRAPAAARLASLTLLSPAEQNQLRREWNSAAAVGQAPRPLAELVLRSAARTPEAVALSSADGQLSYRALGAAARALAGRLGAAGVGPEVRVGVLLERSLALPVALLAVLEAGGAYVPLDVEAPRECLALLLADARPALVLSTPALAGLLPAEVPALLLDGAPEGAPSGGAPAPNAARASLDGLAYVIFTSGSTGRPKGAMNAHRGIVNRILWMQETHPIGAGDRLLSKTPITFDVSVPELFWPLIAGARLVVAPPGAHRDPSALAALIAREVLTGVHFVPSMLRAFLASESLASLASVERLQASGEELGADLVAALGRELPRCAVINLYGPTETAVEVTAARCLPGEPVAIGRPISGLAIYLLDRDGAPVPIGVVGELAIGGVGVGRGYLARPAQTAERFVPDAVGALPGARLYRSGDLARCRADGSIEFLGRADAQVKIRGVRIELGEVEHHLAAVAGVASAAVLAAGEGAQKRLVAYAVAGPGAGEVARLRAALAARLPEALVPTSWVLLERMPLLGSGKIDRRALAALGEGAAPAEVAYVAPRNAREARIAAVWAEVLGREELGVESNLFDLGAHSLIAAQVKSRLDRELGAALPLRRYFELPTVAAQAAALAELDGAAASAPPLSPVPRTGALPLSFSQQRIWFFDRFEPGSPVFNLPTAVTLAGELRIDALAASLNRIVARHEVLRTRFLEVGGEPVQVIEPFVRSSFPVVDLTALGAADGARCARQLERAEALRAFDLSRVPLLRALLLRLAPQRHAALLTVHHIAADGWSMRLLTEEFSAGYLAHLDPAAAAGSAALAPLPIQYADYAAWQRGWLQGEVLAAELAFWKEQLEGAPELLDLPFDRPRGAVQRYRGGRARLVLGAGETAALHRLARAAHGTLFMVLAAAWGALLLRTAGQDDIALGTLLANRQRREVERLIGFFVNTLVLRARMPRGDSFQTVLARVRATTLDLYSHQDLPFEKLVEERNPTRHLSATPIFQVLLILQNAPRGVLALPGLSFEAREVERDAVNYDLLFTLEEHGAELSGVLDYDRDLFDATTVERLLRHFRRLLAAVAAEPEQRWAEVPLLSAGERHQLEAEWNDTRQTGGLGASFHELVAAQVAARPGARAAVCGASSRTYGELWADVERGARGLLAQGVRQGQTVAILAERGLDFLTSTLAILRLGGSYLPLDPGHPEKRLTQVLAGAGGPPVVVARALRARLDEALTELAAEVPVVEIEVLLAAPPPVTAPSPVTAPLPEVPAFSEDLAYVLFTSGSTGLPKGVMIDHRGMVNHLLANVEVLHLGSADVVAQNASQCFDISVWQLFAPLIAGGLVRIVPNEIAQDPRLLLAEVVAGGVTMLELVPSLLAAMLEELEALGQERPRLPHLRWLMPTGEALPPSLCARWLALYPEIPLLNAYGPAECADDVSFEAIRRPLAKGARSVPIGRPVRNLELYVLDRSCRPVPVGVAGEICVGGAGVGRGYLRAPRKTAAAFVPHPAARAGERLYRSGDLGRLTADGRLEFLGRVDHQVKVRGFRIETGEIEAVLLTHPRVETAVVVADGAGAQSRLLAYVTPEAGWAAAELGAFLGERLPDYMVPSLFVPLAALPLTPNGKVDRKALPAPEPAAFSGARTPPTTRAERTLAAVWCEVLGVARVGLEDSFFTLGGHSLLATQVLARLRAALGVDLPLRDVFEAQTLGALAGRIDAALGAGTTLDRLPIPRASAAEARRLSFAQERLWFLDQFDPGSPSYNLANAVRVAGTLSVPVLGRCLAEVVRRHEPLRMTFHGEAGRSSLEIAPAFSPAMPVLDLAGLSAADAERETQGLATREARRPFRLDRLPLLRSTLLRRGGALHALLLTMHHIVSDGWSLGVFLGEVAALYPAFAASRPSPLPELPVRYTDYAAWQRTLLQGALVEEQLAYWKEALADAPPALDLAGKSAAAPPADAADGRCSWFHLERELAAGLNALSRRRGTTLFMTLLAGFGGLLNRLSGASDVMIGVPIAGRGRLELEGLIGFFVNTLVVRVQSHGRPAVADLLARVRQTTLAALSHGEVPFEKLVAEVNPDRDLARSPLFQVMFALQNAPAPAFELPELRLSRLEIDPGTIRFELYLELTEVEGELAGMLQFSRALFDDSFITRLAAQLRQVLAGMVAFPERPFDALALLSAAEEAEVVREWNDRAAALPYDTPFQELFAAAVARFGGKTAAASAGEALTYTELAARSARLGGHLAARGAGPETVVAVLAERGLDFLTAVVAVLSAGAAYLPLDPRHPAPRVAQVLAQSRAPLVLAARALRPLAEAAATELASAPALLELEALLTSPGPALPAVRGSADHLAYVIFTSGSTGVPKGAELIHRGLTNHLIAMERELGLVAGDAVAQTANQCFDISVWQLLTPLILGGRVEIYGDAVAHDPALLLDRIEADAVAVLEIVPSLWRLMLAELERRGEARPALAALRALIPTGEAVPADLCRAWLDLYPRVALVNGYGPAECSDDVSLHRLTAAELATSSRVSIGRPIANTALYVLDGSFRPLPARVAGELAVGGVGVGRGYLARPGLTAAAFVPDPFGGVAGARLYRTGDLARCREDGALEFLGRVDHQVKIRGFRLEPGEIEARLAEHPGLADNVVVARAEASGGKILVAYCVPRPEAAPAPAELREFLKAKLPEYAVPSAWVMLERLPLSPNGKVDRRALPAPDAEASPAAAYVAPRNEVEEAVAEIFAQVIGRERVGAFDDFFDLGGHSLLATQAIWRLRETFGVELELRALFEATTVAALAGLIEEKIIAEIESMSEDEVDAELEQGEHALSPAGGAESA